MTPHLKQQGKTQLTKLHKHVLAIIKGNLFKVSSNKDLDTVLVPVLGQGLRLEVGLEVAADERVCKGFDLFVAHVRLLRHILEALQNQTNKLKKAFLSECLRDVLWT